MGSWKIVEKNNHNALHALCDSQSDARRYLDITVPDHCARGFYMDKTLTPESFEVLPPKKRKEHDANKEAN